MAPSDSTWVPGLLFAFLGCFFLQKAIRPGAKQTWSWGRGGGAVPLSRWGYASWAAAFLSIAVIIVRAPNPPLALVVGFFVSFFAMLAAGFFDTRRYNNLQRTRNSNRDQSS